MQLPDVSEVQELTIAPKGTYDLQITRLYDDPKGEYFIMNIEILDQVNVKEIVKFMGVPTGEDTPQQKGRKLRELKELAKVLNLDPSNMSTEQIEPGATFTYAISAGKDKNDIEVNQIYFA